MRGERIERRGVGDLPAVERRPLVLVGMHDDALLAIVHPQSQRAAALVDELHAEEPGAVVRPIVEVLGADADIAQRVEIHRCFPGRSPARIERYHIRGKRVKCRFGGFGLRCRRLGDATAATSRAVERRFT